MRDDIEMQSETIEGFRHTALTDSVAALRAEVARIALNHASEIRHELCCIDEFDPGPPAAHGGAGN